MLCVHYERFLWRGRIAWLIPPHLKCGIPQGIVGSNPTLSARVASRLVRGGTLAVNAGSNPGSIIPEIPERSEGNYPGALIHNVLSGRKAFPPSPPCFLSTGSSACYIYTMTSKIVNREQLASHLESHRQTGRKIVFTNGCFDILHVGHIRYLQQAKDLGDILVVALNTDASVRELKGPNRPLNPELERAEMMAALGCVDYVTFFPEATPENTISLFRPHYHVKGGDYAPEDMPETQLVRSYGGEVVIVGHTPDRSTTGIINRAKETRIQINNEANE